MNDLFCQAATAAMNQLKESAGVIGLSNTDEFTFRSHFMLAIKKLLPDAQCFSEWNRVDLLVRHAGENHLLEFKYYVHRRSIRLDGTASTWKGGPGPKNEGEFFACVNQLNTCTFHPVASKHLVLVYEKENPRKSQYCFGRSYGALQAKDAIAEVIDVPHGYDSMACKVLQIK